jgi:hypothetical protein
MDNKDNEDHGWKEEFLKGLTSVFYNFKISFVNNFLMINSKHNFVEIFLSKIYHFKSQRKKRRKEEEIF